MAHVEEQSFQKQEYKQNVIHCLIGLEESVLFQRNGRKLCGKHTVVMLADLVLIIWQNRFRKSFRLQLLITTTIRKVLENLRESG